MLITSRTSRNKAKPSGPLHHITHNKLLTQVESLPLFSAPLILAVCSPPLNLRYKVVAVPELPEVETVVRGLQALVGQIVTKVELFSGARQIYGTEQLVGCKLLAIKSLNFPG